MEGLSTATYREAAYSIVRISLSRGSMDALACPPVCFELKYGRTAGTNHFRMGARVISGVCAPCLAVFQNGERPGRCVLAHFIQLHGCYRTGARDRSRDSEHARHDAGRGHH